MIARRLAVGAAVMGLVAVAAWADRLPVSTVPEITAYTAEVAAVPQPLACPGEVVIPVGDTATGDETLDSGSAERVFRALAAAAQANGEGFRTEAEAGTQVERVGSGDVAGLSATACLAPSTEAWLVGGSTALGSSARLVLTNPTTASSEVTVELYGPLGRIDESTVVSVAAHGQVDLLLEGVAAEVPTLAVHVTATGAGVSAALQDSRLAGFQPAGTDWVAPGAAPSTRLVIPAAGPSTADAPGLVRLLAPEGATVSLTFGGSDGSQEWGGVTDLALEPGVVTDVPLPATGTGGVEVVADGPVVAGALTRVMRAVDDGPAGAVAYDLAWSAAVDASALDGSATAAVAGPFTEAVAVHALEGGTFRLTAEDGTVVAERVIGKGATVELPIDIPDGTVVSATGAFAWTLVMRDQPGFLAYVAPVRTEVPPVTVTVAPGTYVEAVPR